MDGHEPHSLEDLPIAGKTGILHYSCNAPSQEILTRHNIIAVGRELGCANSREVLRIPITLFENKGHQVEEIPRAVLTINTESMLRSLR